MRISTITYNERSWAIDLIGHLKSLSAASNRSIKDAGGEQSIKVDGNSLFPDVLLFGDKETARILQGWELKMPDTSIYNSEFRNNAKIKSIALGLDSFVLWNVKQAHLYIWNKSINDFEIANEWNSLNDITTRNSVFKNRSRWESLATEIFYYLNDLFDRGELEGKQFVEAYKSGGITDLILSNSSEVKNALIDESIRDNIFKSKMILWWDRYRAEYGTDDMELVLSKAIISNWVGKMLFAHILRENDNRAISISNIEENTTPIEALLLFKKLSEDCNFWTIFSDSLGLSLITSRTWSQLKQFNRLLSDLRLGSVDQEQLSGILEATVEVTTRKLRGQYPTPKELARLLVNICIRNVEKDRVIDPCCGSGTIVREALDLKLSKNVSEENATKSVFASDQDPQAVQITTFALAKPKLMNLPIRIFQKDVFLLQSSDNIEFRHPLSGELFSEKLGKFDVIMSNLPFVAQKGREQYGNALKNMVSKLGIKDFSKRADVSAYLPFSLHSILNNNGRLGIIITNAWLGTDWGDDFYNLLENYYNLKCVITSGAGRWFKNSRVVTNILIMDKKESPEQQSGDVKYIVLTRPLEAISDETTVNLLAALIELGQTHHDSLVVRNIKHEQIYSFRKLGLGGSAQFVNCDWVLNLPLVPLNSIFKIKRGARRGKNMLFYPKAGHGIEKEYIKPLAKSPQDFKKLVFEPTKEAFFCSKSESELLSLGHLGALNWINSFKTKENVKKLSKKNKHWYEMNAEEISDLVMFINYGQRLFVGRVNPPSFSDQRLVPLTPINGIDIELYHAILNSAISMFIIEGMGFGRGQGALDLNKDRISKFMHILDINKLNDENIEEIKKAFKPLTKREIMSTIADELDQSDRIFFDEIVISAFNIGVNRQTIYDSLLTLVTIRLTALQ